MARSCEKWWQSSYLYYFFKPATFLPASGQARRVHMLHTAYPSCSLKLAPLCWGFVTIKASHHPIPLRPASHNSFVVCMCICLSVWVYMCVQSMKESLVFYCLPLPSTDPYVSPPFSVSLIQPVHQWPYKYSLHSPWCLSPSLSFATLAPSSHFPCAVLSVAEHPGSQRGPGPQTPSLCLSLFSHPWLHLFPCPSQWSFNQKWLPLVCSICG